MIGKDRVVTAFQAVDACEGLEVEFSGANEAIRRAIEEVPLARPGERFIYSDINYFLLGDIVRRVSGEPLDRYAKAHIFDPLGLESEGTRVDFQVGSNSYLYGTRFITWLAYRYSPEQVVAWVARK